MQFCKYLLLDYYSNLKSTLSSSTLNICSALTLRGQFSQECEVKAKAIPGTGHGGP
jgi:hypothetical protein